jgi:hypothetical protein
MTNRTSNVLRFLILAGVLLAITLIVFVTSAAAIQLERETIALRSGISAHSADVAGYFAADEVAAMSQAISNTIYLPVTSHNFCRDFLDDFSDDFSNPDSGWFTGEDAYVRSEYLNEEFRIFTKQTGYFYLYRAPTCPRDNYTLEVDARWVGEPGSSYGLIFGLADDYSHYYLFDMNTDYQMYRLLRRDSAGFTVVAPAAATPAIHGGTATNHMTVVRQSNQISLAINGTVLFDQIDFPNTGLKYVGLVTAPYNDRPDADARFDNFQLIRLTTTAREAAFTGTEPGPVTPPAGRQSLFIGRLDDLPAWAAAGS